MDNNNNPTPLLKSMQAQVNDLIQRLNLDRKTADADALEQRSMQPDFWSNPAEAQKVMQQLSGLKAQIERWKALESRVNDTLELAELNDESLAADIIKETEAMVPLLDKMSLEVLFSDEHDRANALLSIHAGAGGTDAQDWAQMLERMYLRWVGANGYKVEILDRSDGEEAGLKSVTMSIKGDYAYGYLRSEQGVHRLVRLSPFNSSGSRETSFAKVELWPDIEGTIDIDVQEKDLRIDTYRSSGAGGQNVQKNETAIRITHLPTGLVVSCQNERSQMQNRERAMQVLKSRLYELERKKHDAEISALKGENVDAGWGNQIRSYVLHPYQLVKDHRTNHEMGNSMAVLNGELSSFMEAFLRYRIGETSA